MSEQSAPQRDAAAATPAGDARPVELSRPWKTLWVVVQLGLLVACMRAFGIQNSGFQHVFALAAGGFVVHALLPMRFRTPFFALLSVTSIVVALGVQAAAWIVGLGLVLIGMAHLPVSMPVRALLLMAVGGVLALFRADSALVAQLPGPLSAAAATPVPWSNAVWPILGSMFMFRMACYIYDLEHARKRPTVAQTIAYFYMLPNVCFPLFPVVDFKRFQRDYFNQDHHEIYQRGVLWIFRGVLQLVLYRVVYQYLVIDPLEVDGLWSVLRFSLSAFLLYLHVSGQFHLIVGMLLLFGFNLPETHHRYFFAATITDFWRRINIYWKDFMMKLFYYPVHFKLKRFGEMPALVLATLVVFVVTWFLHMVQWFWLLGTVLLEWHDILFWAILAALVVVNSLHEVRHGRARAIGQRSQSLAERATVALTTGATFTVICLLWAMWSSDSMGQWLTMWRTTGHAWIFVACTPVVLFLASLITARIARGERDATVHAAPGAKAAARPRLGAPQPATPFWRPALACGGWIVLLALLGQSFMTTLLPERLGGALARIQTNTLNSRDLAQLEIGYYEDLIGVNRHNTELWDSQTDKPEDWGAWSDSAKVFSRDFTEYVYAPNVTATFKGALVTTNRWGFRDRDYEIEKPPGTVRVALLGASHVFGSGVANQETFEAVLEERLNAEAGNGEPDGAKMGGEAAARTSRAGRRFEILNFARGGRMALNQVEILEESALEFSPDVVFYVAHSDDATRIARSLGRLIRREIEIPYAPIRETIARADVDSGMQRYTIEKRLIPHAQEMLVWAYHRFVASCREHDVVPVWIYMPLTYERLTEADIAADMAVAADCGFEVLSLVDAYDAAEPEALTIAPWDNHPNPGAHRMIAERLHELIMARQAVILGDDDRAQVMTPEDGS